MRVNTFAVDEADISHQKIDCPFSPDLILYFSDRDILPELHAHLRDEFSGAQIAGCSTGGQFTNQNQSDSVAVGAFLKFDNAQIRVASHPVKQPSESMNAAIALAEEIKAADLAGVIVLSDGINVNGSGIAAGLSEALGGDIPVLGGLAGDGSNFEKTLVGLNDIIEPNTVICIGVYGEHVKFGHGSQGGWSAMGPLRKVTRSEDNILYELDGKPALDLYKTYLGDEADNLPSSALLFPLEIASTDTEESSVVRTILNVDHEQQSMIFAGDIAEGASAQMMQASIESLIDGASSAAESNNDLNPESEFAVMVSCIGRKLLMGQRAEEDVDAASESLGSEKPFIGFYSYGEICPGVSGGFSQLHNQTMTVWTIAETAGAGCE